MAYGSRVGLQHPDCEGTMRRQRPPSTGSVHWPDSGGDRWPLYFLRSYVQVLLGHLPRGVCVHQGRLPGSLAYGEANGWHHGPLEPSWRAPWGRGLHRGDHPIGHPYPDITLPG